jgi:hypothetical protein
MNAAVVSAFDAPPRYAPFAEPVAAEGEKIVHVTAAGLHPIVKALAKGTHYGSTGELPFIPVQGGGVPQSQANEKEKQPKHRFLFERFRSAQVLV